MIKLYPDPYLKMKKPSQPNMAEKATAFQQEFSFMQLTKTQILCQTNFDSNAKISKSEDLSPQARNGCIGLNFVMPLLFFGSTISILNGINDDSPQKEHYQQVVDKSYGKGGALCVKVASWTEGQKYYQFNVDDQNIYNNLQIGSSIFDIKLYVFILS